jgi:hypothetical protein
MWCKRLAASALAIAMGLFTLSLWAQNKAVVQDHDISAMHEPLPESRVAPPPSRTGRANLARVPEESSDETVSPASQSGPDTF